MIWFTIDLILGGFGVAYVGIPRARNGTNEAIEEVIKAIRSLAETIKKSVNKNK